MVRKQVFSREDIIQAGFRLVDATGYEQLTARGVAQMLGSSTAPVYSNFGNMEELTGALVDEAMFRLLELIRKAGSGNEFQDLGIGVLDFALQHPRWYEAVFMNKIAPVDPGQNFMEKLMNKLNEMPELAELDSTERAMVLTKMAVFTHGLATEICTGRGVEHTREDFIFLMSEVGETMVRDAFERCPRSPEEIERLAPFKKCCNDETPNKEED